MQATRSDAPYGRLAAWLVLIAGLIISFWAWHAIREDIDEAAQAQFAFRVEEVTAAIRARMLAYEQVLRGAVGLFEASEEVTRAEWRVYVAALRIEENYPGILGIGFARHIARAQLAAHVQAVRAEGFTDYAVRPQGERGEFTSIVFIEPFDDRNRRAFGYDMFSEPVRRAAMERARDGAASAVSNKVILAQETSDDT